MTVSKANVIYIDMAVSSENAPPPKSTISAIFRFLGISWYKFKPRFWCNLNLYREIYVSWFGGFRGCSTVSGTCHMVISISRDLYTFHMYVLCIYFGDVWCRIDLLWEIVHIDICVHLDISNMYYVRFIYISHVCIMYIFWWRMVSNWSIEEIWHIDICVHLDISNMYISRGNTASSRALTLFPME